MIGGAAVVLLAVGVGACPEIRSCAQDFIGGCGIFSLSWLESKTYTACEEDGNICQAATQEYPCCAQHASGTECFTRDIFANGVIIGNEMMYGGLTDFQGLQCTETLVVNQVTEVSSVDCHPAAGTTTTPAQPAIAACPGDLYFYAPPDNPEVHYSRCHLDSDDSNFADDKVCSARTDNFECCLWNSGIPFSFCYATATAAEAPCDNSLAQTPLGGGNILYSRNCSDHTPASTTTTTTTTTTTPPAHACPGQFTGPVLHANQYVTCQHDGYTFSTDDDRVCSAFTDGFDCCVWTNSSAFESKCYENAVAIGGQLQCTDTLALLELGDPPNNLFYGRNCSDHNHSALPTTTTTPPAQPADDSGLSTGAVAGIAVGAVAFVGLAAAAAVCL